FRDAHPRLRSAALHRRLQVAGSHRGLRWHRGRAEDIPLVERAEPGVSGRLLLAGRWQPRPLHAPLPRAGAIAIRTGALSDSRERAQVLDPRPGPTPVQADRL